MIKQALYILKNQGIVGMPTETVYGLAARIDSPAAVEKVFATKERPFFDPLIVHIASKNQIPLVVSKWPEAAEVLAQKFWPGPLTLVLPKNPRVNNQITAGLDTVAIRWPAHHIAQELIFQSGPLAAPSANKFGKISPTTAAHVSAEFPDLFVLDGGSCEVGIESTILEIKQVNQKTELTILRPGMITYQQITDSLRAADISWKWVPLAEATAPGNFKHHYMPTKPLIYVQDLGKFTKEPGMMELVLSEKPEIASRNLYAELRNLCEQSETEKIYFIEKPMHKIESWNGITNRLQKAASILL